MSRSSQRKNRRERLARLKSRIRVQEDYIAHLERVSEAYTRLDELSREELIEADQIIRAQEIIQEMLREEKKDAVETIHAHESVHELMSEEKKMADMTIRAHEQVEALAAREKKEAIETIRALHSIEELAARERQEAYSFIEAQDKVSQLSMQELVERDKALHAILKVNSRISSHLDEDLLLAEILDSMTDALSATHGSVWLSTTGGCSLALCKGIAPAELKAESLAPLRAAVETACETQQSQIHVPGNQSGPSSQQILSWIIVPLRNGDETLGALAAVTDGSRARFRPFDPDLAAIFAGQAAISLVNARMYKRIRQQNDELLRLGTLKSQFIAHVSDELTDPVQALQRSWLKLAEYHGMSEEEHAKFLRSLKGKLDRIDTTVSRILTITSLEEEARELFTESTDFAAITTEVLERHQQHVTEMGLVITSGFDPAFANYRANHSIIRTVLDELLSNAIYYNKPGGTIDVRGHVKGEYLVLDIIDTGRGIRNEEQEMIFQQFYRTEESDSMNEAGAGLGLFMARSFVERYQGKLSVQSVFGQGSTFTATFLMH